jgi:hypothetical protein
MAPIFLSLNGTAASAADISSTSPPPFLCGPAAIPAAYQSEVAKQLQYLLWLACAACIFFFFAGPRALYVYVSDLPNILNCPLI